VQGHGGRPRKRGKRVRVRPSDYARKKCGPYRETRGLKRDFGCSPRSGAHERVFEAGNCPKGLPRQKKKTHAPRSPGHIGFLKTAGSQGPVITKRRPQYPRISKTGEVSDIADRPKPDPLLAGWETGGHRPRDVGTGFPPDVTSSSRHGVGA